MDAYINQLKHGRTHFVNDELILEAPTKAGIWAASRIQFLEQDREVLVKQYNILLEEQYALIEENEKLIKELESVRNDNQVSKSSGTDRLQSSD